MAVHQRPTAESAISKAELERNATAFLGLFVFRGGGRC
jgi:hypothetical protein